VFDFGVDAGPANFSIRSIESAGAHRSATARRRGTAHFTAHFAHMIVGASLASHREGDVSFDTATIG